MASMGRRLLRKRLTRLELSSNVSNRHYDSYRARHVLIDFRKADFSISENRGRTEIAVKNKVQNEPR